MSGGRFAHVEALAERGLLEFCVIDPGCVNMTLVSASRDDDAAQTYVNPESDVREGLQLAARYGFHPIFGIYEPGFTRAGAVLSRTFATPAPVGLEDAPFGTTQSNRSLVEEAVEVIQRAGGSRGPAHPVVEMTASQI
jgi:hypothetical protein